MCACVCICAYMYVYVYICIYTYMCVCVCICILICMSVFNMALGFIALFYLLLSSKALFATIFLYEKCYINKVWLIDFVWRVLSPLASTSGSSSYSHDMHHQPWGHNSRKLQLQSKVLNMVHSDSMSPTFPDTWEKCELSSSQRGASTKLSQFILTSCLGLPGLPNSPPVWCMRTNNSQNLPSFDLQTQWRDSLAHRRELQHGGAHPGASEYPQTCPAPLSMGNSRSEYERVQPFSRSLVPEPNYI